MEKVICTNLDGTCRYKHLLKIGEIYYVDTKQIFEEVGRKKGNYFYFLDVIKNKVSGYFDVSMFNTPAQWRENQINSILKD